MTNRSRHSPTERKRRQRFILILVGLIGLSIFVCSSITIGGGLWFVNSLFDRDEDADTQESVPLWPPDSAELTVAASPVMAPVLADLALRFNEQQFQTPDGQSMQVFVETHEPEKMIDAALSAPPFQAISPDSSLWLDRLEQRWSTGGEDEAESSEIPIGQRRVGDQIRYAVSPIVIAAWESVALELGWPEKPIGWQDIQDQATQDENFKWNHPSTNNAAGLLATLAEFYAGAGLTRGLTQEIATAPETLDYVQAVESTVRFYGEGEEVIIERLADEGRDFLDAFVAQERIVIDWNRNRSGERLVAIYPAEGTLWTDHPLALLELGTRVNELAVTENQRLTYQAFSEFMTTEESQLHLLSEGYRPADLTISLESETSPFANTDAVDWRQPQTTLQMPSPAVVDVIRDVWYYTKRPTNVILVVDTSGSMDDDKLERTREALNSFVVQIRGDKDRVGLVEFGAGVKSFTPLQTMDTTNRDTLLTAIEQMEAYGGTALVDAVFEATLNLQSNATPDTINAIVVMTDGLENESYYGIRELQDLIMSRDDASIVIFTIGFGADADEITLRRMAEIGSGQYRRADETDIEELYRVISTYF